VICQCAASRRFGGTRDRHHSDVKGYVGSQSRQFPPWRTRDLMAVGRTITHAESGDGTTSLSLVPSRDRTAGKGACRYAGHQQRQPS